MQFFIGERLCSAASDLRRYAKVLIVLLDKTGNALEVHQIDEGGWSKDEVPHANSTYSCRFTVSASAADIMNLMETFGPRAVLVRATLIA